MRRAPAGLRGWQGADAPAAGLPLPGHHRRPPVRSPLVDRRRRSREQSRAERARVWIGQMGIGGLGSPIWALLDCGLNGPAGLRGLFGPFNLLFAWPKT